MSTIGEQIKKYRIEKGITQEQLGQMIGVTTQAVSRWERGGTPDVELLPRLSDILDVSIDSLFGRKEQSMTLSLARRLSQMTDEEAYRYAFSICWAIEIGLLGDVSIIDDFMNKFIDNPSFSNDEKTDYFARIVHDNGIANLRMSSDFQHFFLMVEPHSGIREQLSDPESIREVFALFADEKLLRILFYMYSLPHMPIDTSLISKHTGLDQKEVDKCMESLCSHNLATHTVVATAAGDLHSYAFRKESFVIPLLCMADEIAQKEYRPFLGGFFRHRSFL